MEAKHTNLFDYIAWRGDLTMEADPFNRVDAMILSRFVYVPFQLAMGEKEDKTHSIKEIAGKLCAHADTMGLLLNPQDMQLMEALAKSKRYRNLALGNFVNLYDEEEETQFSAITVKITSGVYCLVYRGTDDTLVGWKEDLNLAYTFPIAGQRHAKEYLEDFAATHRGSLILCGHSKGGNIAVYAAAFAGERVQKRIAAVYNFDGPGFMEDVFEHPGYKNMEKRIETYLPQDSVVGMLLGHLEEYHVIHSHENLLMQHVLYSWDIMGKDFVYENSVSEGSSAFNEALKEWIGQLDSNQREEFGEVFYSLLTETKSKTVHELTTNWAENSKTMINAMRDMDETTRKSMSDIIGLFMKCAWGHVPSPKQIAVKKRRK